MDKSQSELFVVIISGVISDLLNCGGLSRGSSPLHAPKKEKNMFGIELEIVL